MFSMALTDKVLDGQIRTLLIVYGNGIDIFIVIIIIQKDKRKSQILEILNLIPLHFSSKYNVSNTIGIQYVLYLLFQPLFVQW